MSPIRPAPPLFVLVALTMTGSLSLNIFVPSMPGMVAYFGTDVATVQLTLTLYLAGMAVGQLAYGPLSDRFGRRPVLLCALSLFVVGTTAAALAPTVGLLILARAAQALGGCAGMVITRAIVRDVFDRDAAASAIGYIMAGMAVAPAVAPAIGGFLELWFSWRASFVFVGLFGAAVLLLSWHLLSETNHTRADRIDVASILSGYRYFLGSGVYLGYALVVAFLTGAFFTFLGGAPYVVVEVIGAGPQQYGLYFVLVAGGYIFGNFLAGRLSSRLGVDRMVVLGVSLAILGGVLAVIDTLLLPPTLIGLFGPMTLMSMGSGVGQPNAIAAAVSVDPRRAGAASGLLGFLQIGFGVVMTWAIGGEVAESALPLVLIMAGASVAALASYGLARLSRAAAAMPEPVVEAVDAAE